LSHIKNTAVEPSGLNFKGSTSFISQTMKAMFIDKAVRSSKFQNSAK